MYQENDHYHYSEEEVMEIFKPELDSRNWQINKSEFRNFCKLLSCLNKEFVDMLNKEVMIVVCSLERDVRMNDKRMPCGFVNLQDDKFLKLKKAIMVFSPYLLTLTFAGIKLKKIFHEIAHYKLNHPMMDVDKALCEKNEQEAEGLAIKWYQEEIHHLNCLSPLKKES